MEEEKENIENENFEKSFIEARKNLVMNDGRNMYGQEWQDVTNDFAERVLGCLMDSGNNRFCLRYVAKPMIMTNHYVINLHGGRNGNGIWMSYLVDARNIFENLLLRNKGNFKKVYLIDWRTDVANDVFDMWIGVEQ